MFFTYWKLAYLIKQLVLFLFVQAEILVVTGYFLDSY